MEMSGALAATPWPVLGEVVLPHLRLAEELRTQVPVEVVYTAEAWDLWLHALEELQGSEMPALQSVAAVHESLRAKLEAAPQALRDKLVLRPEHVVAAQREPAPAAAGAGAVAPTDEEEALAEEREWLHITPPPCKNDRTGTKYGNSPVPAAYHPTRPINFMREVVKYELMRKVAPDRRRQAPLVLGPDGSSWTKKDLDAFFKALLAMVVEPRRARRLSVHSFRVWLAGALLAAGASPEQIMLLLRWSSDAARQLYARLGDQSQVQLIDAAADATVDSIRSHTLMRRDW
jgi:hypothetical protein